MDSDAILQEALRLGEEQDWEGMARELEAALERFPEAPELHCWLGVAELELGLDGSAYDRFKAALALDPQDPLLLATAGSGLALFDDPDAESALRTAALLAPDLLAARQLYGAYLSREGLFTDALRELEAAAELAPEDAAIAYELGVALALKGDLEAALSPLALAVELNPGEGWTLVVLGMVEAELGRLEDAARDLAEGARLRPDDVEAQLLAALAAGAAGWEDLAWEMLERGRQVADGDDLDLIEEMEEPLEEGAESAGSFLTQEVLPVSLHARLMTRP